MEPEVSPLYSQNPVTFPYCKLGAVHDLLLCFFKFVLTFSFHLSILSSTVLSGLPGRIFNAFPIFPMHAMYSAHLNILNLNTLTIFGQHWKSLSSLLGSFFPGSYYLRVLGPCIFLTLSSRKPWNCALNLNSKQKNSGLCESLIWS